MPAPRRFFASYCVIGGKFLQLPLNHSLTSAAGLWHRAKQVLGGDQRLRQHKHLYLLLVLPGSTGLSARSSGVHPAGHSIGALLGAVAIWLLLG